MKIVLTGGTGFIGNFLQKKLIEHGHSLVVLTRRPPAKPSNVSQTVYAAWNPEAGDLSHSDLRDADAVINLAGEPIAAKRWTKTQKLRIIESRCNAAHTLSHAIQKLNRKPKVLINASAVGFYGSHGQTAGRVMSARTLTESDGPGTDFLAQTCKAWETHAARVEDFGLRVVRLRIGIVLEKEGGALQKMIPPFQFFIGGPLGSGRQWMSWIHRDDVAGLILWALENEKVTGALNAAAPNPVTMREFASTLGKVMGRPSFATVPGFVLKTLLGEMSDLLLKGQRVIPEKALKLGYQFKYPTLEPALRAILQK